MLQPTLPIWVAKEWILASLATLVAVLFGYAMYNNGRPITGPFIFGDELEYFSYARDLFTGADLSSHTQYGPLYPALASLFFSVGNSESVYRALRLFNIVIFVSSAIPAFLLARMLIPKSSMLLLFPAFVVTAPFSGFVYLIWAEPLYYTLFLWTTLVLLQFYCQPGVAIGSACGILLALLFHAKPGAGIVVQFAAFLSVVVLVCITPSKSRGSLVTPILALGFCCVALTLPWIARNLSLGVGIIGYKTLSTALASRIAEYKYGQIGKGVILSVFYQISYLFIGTWGLLGALVVLPVVRWRMLSTEIRALVVFTITCVAGLIALSAIGMTAHRGLGHWIPNGRYYCVIFPLVILLTVTFLFHGPNPTRSERFWLALVIVMLAGVTIFATPLLVAVPHSFVNNPELALAIRIIDEGNFIWRGEYDPSMLERVVLAGIYGSVGLVMMLVSEWRKILFACVALVLVGSFFMALAEHEYVKQLGSTQSGLNDAVRFLHYQGAVGESAFDGKLEKGNVKYVVEFWTASNKVRYLSREEVADSVGNLPVPGFFVTTEKLSLPLAFHSKGFFIYHLILAQGQSRGGKDILK